VTSCLTNMQSLLDIFWEELVPNLKPEPLKEDPGAYRELQEFAASMKITPEPDLAAGKPRNRCFRFQENHADIRQCGISFGENCCSLTFFTPHGPEQLRAGFGHFEYSVFQLTDTRPHPVAAYAVWRSPDELEIRSFIRDGIYRDIWTVDFSDPEEPVRNRTVCSCFRPAKPRFLTAPEKRG